MDMNSTLFKDLGLSADGMLDVLALAKKHFIDDDWVDVSVCDEPPEHTFGSATCKVFRGSCDYFDGFAVTVPFDTEDEGHSVSLYNFKVSLLPGILGVKSFKSEWPVVWNADGGCSFTELVVMVLVMAHEMRHIHQRIDIAINSIGPASSHILDMARMFMLYGRCIDKLDIDFCLHLPYELDADVEGARAVALWFASLDIESPLDDISIDELVACALASDAHSFFEYREGDGVDEVVNRAIANHFLSWAVIPRPDMRCILEERYGANGDNPSVYCDISAWSDDLARRNEMTPLDYDWLVMSVLVDLDPGLLICYPCLFNQLLEVRRMWPSRCHTSGARETHKLLDSLFGRAAVSALLIGVRDDSEDESFVGKVSLQFQHGGLRRFVRHSAVDGGFDLDVDRARKYFDETYDRHFPKDVFGDSVIFHHRYDAGCFFDIGQSLVRRLNDDGSLSRISSIFGINMASPVGDDSPLGVVSFEKVVLSVATMIRASCEVSFRRKICDFGVMGPHPASLVDIACMEFLYGEYSYLYRDEKSEGAHLSLFDVMPHQMNLCRNTLWKSVSYIGRSKLDGVVFKNMFNVEPRIAFMLSDLSGHIPDKSFWCNLKDADTRWFVPHQLDWTVFARPDMYKFCCAHGIVDEDFDFDALELWREDLQRVCEMTPLDYDWLVFSMLLDCAPSRLCRYYGLGFRALEVRKLHPTRFDDAGKAKVHCVLDEAFGVDFVDALLR